MWCIGRYMLLSIDGSIDSSLSHTPSLSHTHAPSPSHTHTPAFERDASRVQIGS